MSFKLGYSKNNSSVSQITQQLQYQFLFLLGCCVILEIKEQNHSLLILSFMVVHETTKWTRVLKSKEMLPTATQTLLTLRWATSQSHRYQWQSLLACYCSSDVILRVTLAGSYLKFFSVLKKPPTNMRNCLLISVLFLHPVYADRLQSVSLCRSYMYLMLKWLRL